MLTSKIAKKAWVITVDMGYGHQRASYPLHLLAYQEIISANNYSGIPKNDKQIWKHSRRFYEFISRFKKVPVIGAKAFEAFDSLQSIPNFYPRRDLSHPSFQVKEIYRLFKTANWGEHLIKKLSKKPLPLITTFFAVAFMAEYYQYEGEIYCLATDTDISRAWVPIEPATSKINYLAPNRRVAERLKLYGIRQSKIFLVGFPLPEENVGRNLSVIKKDLGKRLINLDPKKIYISQYKETIRARLGGNNFKLKATRPLTIMFAVGGAGAQREMGIAIAKSLRTEIANGKARLILSAGVHPVVNQYFRDSIKKLGLAKKSDGNPHIIFARAKDDYFSEFSKLLRETDILWTKPSELSFYCALGLPIIMTPPIGSQEVFNEDWLESIGAGIKQEDLRYANEWLFDWLNSGWLAEAAMQGFLEAPQNGTYNIAKIIAHQYEAARKIKSVLRY